MERAQQWVLQQHIKKELKLLKNGKKLNGEHSAGSCKLWWLNRKVLQDFAKCTCKRLAVGSASNEVAVRQELFGSLSLVLMRQNTQAILARSN